jgi:cytochrome P450
VKACAVMDRAPHRIDAVLQGESIGQLGLRLARDGHEVVSDGNVTFFLTEDDTERLLTDPRFDAVAMAVLHLSGVTDGPLHDLWSNLMFGKDGDEHRRIRNTVARRFTPAGLAPLEPTFESIARELAAALPDDEIVDLWPAYSLPLAARTACVVVGIPDEDALVVAEWALLLVQAFGILEPEQHAVVQEAARAFTEYLDGLLARKAEQPPGDDVISSLLTEHRDELTYDELRALSANLVFGGLEAVTKALLNSVYHLLQHELWADLDDANIDRAVAELLRFHPPAGGVFRLAGEEIDVGGTVLVGGELAVPNLWAACRDARRYDDPDGLQLDRKPGRPHPFGAGSHFCIGHVQAKLVLASGLRALHERAPRLALAADPTTLRWGQDPFDGLHELPVRIAIETASHQEEEDASV